MTRRAVDRLLGWISRLPLRRKAFIAIGLPVATLLAAVGALYLGVREEVRAGTAVERTLMVRGEMDRLLALSAEAETGVRGYLLAGEEEFLQPFLAAQREVPAVTARLRGLLEGDRDKLVRLADVERLLTRMLGLLGELAAGEFTPDLATQGLAPRLAAGKAVMAELRARVGEMMEVEERALAERRRISEAARQRVFWLIAAAAAVAVAAGLLAVQWGVRGVVWRVGLLAENAALIAAGQTPRALPGGEDEIKRVGEALAATSAELLERARALREANSVLEHLIAAGPAVILRRDPATFLVRYVSPNLERILGWRPDEIVGVEGFWFAQVHPEDLTRFHSEWRDALARGEPGEMRGYRFRHKNGEYRWLRATARLEPGGDGEPPSVLAFFVDLTEGKAAEQELLAARREAEEANRAKNEFLSRMSHELRTPLNVILGFGQLLAMEELAEAQRENVSDILKAGQHLLDLIDEVLDISRIESGRMALSPESIETAAGVQEVFELLRPLAAQASVELAGGPPDSGVHVLADRQFLRQILINLVSNAIKYNRPGGEVRVVSAGVQGRVRLGVRDTGPGIDPQRLDRLFTPFERLGADNSKTPGTGLGLALSRRLAEAMDGRLEVESTPGKGSIFWLELPAAEPPAEPDSPRVVQHRPAPGEAGEARRRVLCIEDNPSNVKVVERILAHRPGLELVTALQGRIGLDLARGQLPDLVLLDLNLVDLEGEKVLRELKRDPLTAPIPVIVVSANATPGRRERLLDQGAFAYVTKPIKVTEFLAALDRALAAGGGNEE